MIRDRIVEIVERYYNKKDDCYNMLRYDHDENESYLIEEIKKLLEDAGVDFNLETETGYCNCSYDSEFLAVAWVEDGKIQLYTLLQEQY